MINYDEDTDRGGRHNNHDELFSQSFAVPKHSKSESAKSGLMDRREEGPFTDSVNLWDDIRKLEVKISRCSEDGPMIGSPVDGSACNRFRSQRVSSSTSPKVDTACDDLQVFISEEAMHQDPGSCFQASSFRLDHHHHNLKQQNHRKRNEIENKNGTSRDREGVSTNCSSPSSSSSSSFSSPSSSGSSSAASSDHEADTAPCEQENCLSSSSSSPLPLCERVKAKKIEIVLRPASHYLVTADDHHNQSRDDETEKTKVNHELTKGKQDEHGVKSSCSSSSSSSSSSLVSSTSSESLCSSSASSMMSELSKGILNLERNEQQLKEKLQQLEWINKEFVRELEMREILFLTRESEEKDWKKIKSNHDRDILELQLARKQLVQKISSLHQSLDHEQQDSSDQNSKWREMKMEQGVMIARQEEQEVIGKRRLLGEETENHDPASSSTASSPSLGKKTEEQNLLLLIENLQKQESNLDSQISVMESQLLSVRIAKSAPIPGGRLNSIFLMTIVF